MYKIDMKDLGLTERFIQEATLYKGLFIGRVSSQSKNLYKVITEYGELLAEISGKMRYEAKCAFDYPAVGDFVMLDRAENRGGNAIIHHILTRKSAFERKAAGTANEVQIVAANIDTVFICMSLNKDFNLRRLERYIAIAWDSRATPVIVLTKSDLCEDVYTKIDEVASVAIAIDTLITSSIKDEGLIAVKNYLKPGKTIAFIGSSGVGKSTLINCLAGGQVLETAGIRRDDKGRHTTTRRELILLESGGIVIDTPGMRELGLESVDLSRTFGDIDELALQCKFHDCAHESEPGCAVRAAILAGNLSEERLLSYKKLLKEIKYAALDFKQIETEKLNTMFAEFGGIKNARDFVKSPKKRF